MTLKASVIGSVVVLDPNGEYDLPFESKLMHRFALVDGQIVDKYNGVSDTQVRVVDHEAAMARNQEEIAAWEALDEEAKEKTPRPIELPPLTLPEE